MRRPVCSLDSEEELRELRQRLAGEPGKVPLFANCRPRGSGRRTQLGTQAAEWRDGKPARPLNISPVQATLIRRSWASAKTRGKVTHLPSHP